MFSVQTKRLLIRDHLEEDLETMHTLLSNSEAMYYLDDIKTSTLEETKENLQTAIEELSYLNRTKYFFRIEDKQQHYIGEIGFTVKLDTPAGKVVEMGYFILPEFWAQGITTEAAEAVLRYGFEQAGVVKFGVGCIRDNVGSERVMQKLGLIKEADFVMRTWHDNRLKDRVEYRLTKMEWEQLYGKNETRT